MTPAKSGTKKRKTIKDVAAEADVSISTVSLALNGTGYVSAETRARIISVAKRLGYVARPAARQLASQQTGNVGFVLRSDHFARSEPFYTHVFLGSEFEAGQHDRYVLLATIPESYVPHEDTPRFLRERNVDGVLVAGKVSTDFISEVESTGLPLVLIDFEMKDHPAVVIDNQAGAREAIEHLIELGHQRIAFLGADTEHPAIRARLEGYKLGMGNLTGAELRENVLIEVQRNPDFETGKLLGERLLALSPRPTAAFCVNDAVALGVLDVARRAKLNLPTDLSVVGFDDVIGAGYASPPLTTVRVFKQQLGELAVRYLEDLIKSNRNPAGAFLRADDDEKTVERRAHDIKVPVELVIRGSTCSPSSRETKGRAV